MCVLVRTTARCIEDVGIKGGRYRARCRKRFQGHFACVIRSHNTWLEKKTGKGAQEEKGRGNKFKAFIFLNTSIYP